MRTLSVTKGRVYALWARGTYTTQQQADGFTVTGATILKKVARAFASVNDQGGCTMTFVADSDTITAGSNVVTQAGDIIIW